MWIPNHSCEVFRASYPANISCCLKLSTSSSREVLSFSLPIWCVIWNVTGSAASPELIRARGIETVVEIVEEPAATRQAMN